MLNTFKRLLNQASRNKNLFENDYLNSITKNDIVKYLITLKQRGIGALTSTLFLEIYAKLSAFLCDLVNFKGTSVFVYMVNS